MNGVSGGRAVEIKRGNGLVHNIFTYNEINNISQDYSIALLIIFALHKQYIVGTTAISNLAARLNMLCHLVSYSS